jgi:hypothetical protein
MVHRLKYLFLGFAIAIAGMALANVFTKFSPASGILVGNPSTYVTTPAASTDVINLWVTGGVGCSPSSTTFLATDGTCEVSTAPEATDTQLGTVLISETGLGNTVPIVNPTPAASSGNPIDCVTFIDTSGTVGDIGTSLGRILGPCAIVDTGQHLIVQSNGFVSVTGSGCTDATGFSGDQSGSITVAAATTCTITFANPYVVAPPNCVVSGFSATVQPFIAAAATLTAATVTTLGAGQFNYVCF